MDFAPRKPRGQTEKTFTELAQERAWLTYLFRSLRMCHQRGKRIQPLTRAEIATIRGAIGPQKNDTTAWQFHHSKFTIQTALRNWLMFETALELGLRRGELLKLRLDSLPRGAETGLKVQRHPDDPDDSRTMEPAVKTAERIIPASRNLLSAIRYYLVTPPPQGRPGGKTPYLFVTRSGRPLSTKMADDIVQTIGQHSGILPLSWHRLRHTWSEQMAAQLREQPNGLDVLMYLGGWTAQASVRHYTQNTIAQQAQAALRHYHDTLYQTEGAEEGHRG